MIPIFLIALIGLIASSWGTQFYITCIEALIFLIALLIITIIEFKTAKMYGYNKIMDPSDSLMDVHAIPSEQEMEKELRRNALKGIINTIRGGNEVFNTNKLEGCVKNERDWAHDRYSLPDYAGKNAGSDGDDSDEHVYPHSYPVSPKTREKFDYQVFPLGGTFQKKLDEHPDNVYADSKPPNPLKKNKKGSSFIKSTQTFSKEGFMGGAFNINEDFFGTDHQGSGKVKHRKRRNAYYNQVEQEDEDGFMQTSSHPKGLGIIYEEDEHGRKVRKSNYADSDSDWENSDAVPISEPEINSKKFNEHSIMGEFDKDEKGNIILLTNEKGNLVCKNGRKVNEKGYLRDRFGHILYASKNRVRAFSEKQLDERGEIPLPYSWDKYNFNAFDIQGNLATDPKTGSPTRMDRRGEELTDKNGFLVNSRGYLVDQNKNIVSRTDGEIKLDAYQLTKDGDVPLLYTYDARRFHLKQVMGDFDKDQDGNIIVLTEIGEDNKSKMVDKRGRPVNVKGYLTDGEAGNIVNYEGVLLFEKHELNPEGEFPKILPYTKFNVDEIRGDLEKDESGKVQVVHENEKGEIMDSQKRRVNAKGYLIDNEGNILDQRGNRVFDLDMIDETGEIPKVFRIGLLRSDSTTSLNRFLEELEKIKHNLGLDDGDLDSGFEEEEKLLMETSENGALKSKRSSENNSMMGDRPSNYNTANLEHVQRVGGERRRDGLESSFSSDDFDVEDPEFLEAIKEKRYRRRIRKKYRRPKKKDILLANAYGGMPRGPKIEPNKLSSARSSKQKLVAASKLNKYERSSLQGESVIDTRKDRPFTKSSKKTLEAETKLNFKPQDMQGRIDDSELGMNSQYDESQLKGVSLGGTLMVDHRPQDTLSQHSDQVRKPRGISKNLNGRRRGRTKKRTRRGKNKDMVSVAPSDLDKLYGKDVDDFLNESDWDIDSMNGKSQISYKSARSYGDKRIRGLESIYLQRLEAGTKKNKRKKKKPKFRALQDRYLNNEDMPRDDYSSSIFSEEKKESYFE